MYSSMFMYNINTIGLHISDNDQWICLCDALSSNCPSSLRNIEISDCRKVKSLFCLSGTSSSCTVISNLECLRLVVLSSLTVICKEDCNTLLCH
ncbi:hypothetical protein RJT34_18506 [Clitoria ternatea]|uniref:Uncharacterized protein n=1 Tax=Clitoria ternatea TaxID=43366 RepID=A0AAN9PEL9_CLITE